MPSARPLLRSLTPSLHLAEAAAQSARSSLASRLQNVGPTGGATLAESLLDGAGMAALQRLQAPLPARLGQPALPGRALRPDSSAGEPASPGLLVPAEGRIASSPAVPSGGAAPGSSQHDHAHTREPSRSSLAASCPGAEDSLPHLQRPCRGDEPGSPKRHPLRAASLTAGRRAGDDVMAGSVPFALAADWRRMHQSRDLTIVTASGNGRKAFFLDTLALVRRLEAEGLTAQQAEAITHVITDVLHESLESAAHTFVSKAEMQKTELVAEATMTRLKTEMQSSNDIRLAGIQKDVEGLRTDLDKVKSELKYEVDKVTAGQRLDLNLERGRVKEELNVHAQETSNLSNKLDREVNALKAQLEAAKFDVIRYCVGTLVSVSAVGLGMLRVLM